MKDDPVEALRESISYAKNNGWDWRGVAISQLEEWLAELEWREVPKEVYVAIEEGTYGEGYSGPVQAFLKVSDAFAARKLIQSCSNSSVDIFAVPVWPQPSANRFTKPVEEIPSAA